MGYAPRQTESLGGIPFDYLPLDLTSTTRHDRIGSTRKGKEIGK